jgi:hypothetical protein
MSFAPFVVGWISASKMLIFVAAAGFGLASVTTFIADPP